MIEMLGVLAIIGVLTVGGIAGYSKAMEHLRNNKIANNISQLATNILTLYAQQKDFSGLYTELVFKAGAVPDSMWWSGGNLRDSIHFKGAYSYSNTYEIYGFGKYLHIAFHTTSKEVCLALATLNWEDYSPNLVGVSLDMRKKEYDYYYDLREGCTKGGHSSNIFACRGYLPISPKNAAVICNQIGWEGHSMILVFKK